MRNDYYDYYHFLDDNSATYNLNHGRYSLNYHYPYVIDIAGNVYDCRYPDNYDELDYELARNNRDPRWRNDYDYIHVYTEFGINYSYEFVWMSGSYSGGR